MPDEKLKQVLLFSVGPGSYRSDINALKVAVEWLSKNHPQIFLMDDSLQVCNYLFRQATGYDIVFSLDVSYGYWRHPTLRGDMESDKNVWLGVCSIAHCSTFIAQKIRRDPSHAG